MLLSFFVGVKIMKPEHKTVQLIVPTTAITAASTANWGYVDTKGYSHVRIELVEMSASAATQIAGLRVREDDTVPTAFTDMSAIVALTGAASTSTSAGFALPFPNSAVENIYQFDIDLKGRKRYIGFDYIPSVTTRAAAVALLMRGEEGQDQKVGTDKTATVTTESLRLHVKV
jgi:hypothetical protein